MKYTAWHLIITLLVAIMLTIFVAISVSHSKTIKIAIEAVRKTISTSVDKSKLDNLFSKDLQQTKSLLKKINS